MLPSNPLAVHCARRWDRPGSPLVGQAALSDGRRRRYPGRARWHESGSQNCPDAWRRAELGVTLRRSSMTFAWRVIKHDVKVSAMGASFPWASATLLAFGDFCLAERILDGYLGFGGSDFHIHPELATIIFDDSDITSVNSSNSSWSVRFCCHVLFRDCGHSRLAGGLRQQVTQLVVSLADLAPAAVT